jgi:hypothetical protein
MTSDDTRPAFAVSYAVSCDICHHEITVEFTFFRNVILTVIPPEWVCIIQDDLESGALKVYYYCPIHNPEPES